jgi:3-isopropylmalate dehydrogenase
MKIAVLAGDGIGPEVMQEALRVLEVVAEKFDYKFEFTEALVGGAAYDKYEHHCPEDTLSVCEKADAILFGSVGGPVAESHLPKWAGCEANSILAIRKAFSFEANYRPAKVYSSLKEVCPLKNRLIEDGIDILIIRELLGDLYFGEHHIDHDASPRHAHDVAEYNENQISVIAHRAFEVARLRNKEVYSVDKANVLSTSKLWRKVFNEVAEQYSDVKLTHMLVDNCAMQLITNPSQFNVIATSNMFGDILSDAAAVLPGSLGLMPSASLNKAGFGLYEPSGGSAPDIAGQNIANPIAQILSAALMLRLSFQLEEAAQSIEQAVEAVIASGKRTRDITVEGEAVLSTSKMTDAIIAAIKVPETV